MVTFGPQLLKTGGEPEDTEELSFGLASLNGCDAMRVAETGYADGEESRLDLRCDPFKRLYLRPSSEAIDGGEALATRSSWWQGPTDVQANMLEAF